MVQDTVPPPPQRPYSVSENLENGKVEVVINNIQELAEATRYLHSQGDFRLWWFRGHRDGDSWKLLPKVKRGYPEHVEQSLANHFYTRAPSRHARCPDVDDFPGWLSLMQHYGLPTRLLDWTRSPLVAAHFAVHSFRRQTTADAPAPCIWCINPLKFNESQGFEPLAMPLNANTLQPIIRPFLKGGDETGQIAAALAVEQDPRMYAQQGAFTVHSGNASLETLVGCEKWLRKFIIPPAAAVELAWDLKFLGIDSSYVFPDLQALAEEITITFAPRLKC